MGRLFLDYPSGFKAIRMVLNSGRGKQKRSNEVMRGLNLLAVKIEEGATSQGMKRASGSWKRPGRGFSSGASRKEAALPTP